MQIHELNNYGGALNAGAYLAVDNGSDTGKVSATELFAGLNADISDLDARIDNIIAGGAAPSEAEIIDARYGADGVTYPSLGDAIRAQIDRIGIKTSLIDATNFAVQSGGSGNWGIPAKTPTSITINHATTYTTGAPQLDLQLTPGKYVFYADFSGSSQKYFRLYKVGVAGYSDLWNGTVFTVNETADYQIVFMTSASGLYVIDDICLCNVDNITNIDKLINKSAKHFVITSGAINVDFNTNKITIPAGYVNVNNNSRIATPATELAHGGYMYFLYYDLSISDFVLKRSTEFADFTNLIFIACIPDSAGKSFISEVPFAINGIIRNRTGEQVNSICIAGKTEPIVITNDRKIIFPKAMYINNDGVSYNISMGSSFVFDFQGDGSYVLKAIYMDTSKLSTVESTGFTNDLFLVREQAINTALNPKYKLIAVIPDSFSENGIRPYTVFDYIIKVETDRKMRLATGFIPKTQEVSALYGPGAIVDATAYDQFPVIIGLWDALLTRANQYGTYVQKCWIDGTAYDNSNRTMTDVPTAGDHNPRGDMNQYPLIMYKFKPANYDPVNDYTATFKPRTKRLLVISGIHGGSSGGDHLESPIAVYYFAKRLVEEFYLTDSLINIRNNYEIDFIPVANPWGINNKQRVNELGIDINRDFDDFLTVEAQQIKALIDSGVYDFVHDSHCLGGTSLTSGDLADHSFVWVARSSRMINVGKQVANYIGAKYSLKTTVQNVTAKTLVAYAGRQNNDGAILTEIPANTPLYYGDTVGEPHGEEVVKRGSDFIQNTLAVIGNYIENYNYSDVL